MVECKSDYLPSQSTYSILQKSAVENADGSYKKKGCVYVYYTWFLIFMYMYLIFQVSLFRFFADERQLLLHRHLRL